MKNMKKLISLLLALMMVLTMGVAFAEGEGTITLNTSYPNSAFHIYRMLDLESYDTTSGAYSYKVNSAWANFFATAEAKAYFNVDDNGYATWKLESEEDSIVAAFSKLAMNYAKANDIAAVLSTDDEADMASGNIVVDAEGNSVVFKNLPLGYYLVDSDMGALCGITTTNPHAYVNTKNGIPQQDKQVQEDQNGQWSSENSADVGQVVNFRVTITVEKGAENYALHDRMSAGLTFNPDSVTMKHTNTASGEHDVDPSKFTVKTSETCDDAFEAGACSFEITLSDAFCDELKQGDTVTVFYSATVNENAIMGGTGNINESRLEYGEDHFTTTDTTITKTFSVDLIKTDSQNTLINGAEFKLYDAATDGNEIKVKKMANGNYRLAQAGEDGENIVVTNGQVKIIGLDAATYYLEEVVTPVGYNQLSGRQSFTISASEGNIDASFIDGNYVDGSGVHVVNKSGSMLPSTGGMGTTLFYVAGGVLVAAAVVLLVSKKRMESK